MSGKALTVATAICACVLTLAGSVSARAALEYSDGRDGIGTQAQQNVAHEVAAHRVGRLLLAVNNNGTFATGFTVGPPVDAFTGEFIPAGGGEYPRGSNNQYVFAASFWVGAVIGRDTLVSTGADGWLGITEMFPDEPPFGKLVKRSIIDPTKPEYEGAVSEEDYIAVYTDTFINLAPADPDDGGRQHRPLYVQVTQSSFAWSYSYAEDLILFDYQIQNIGTQRLRNVYMGVYVDADVCSNCDEGGFDDDICGFRLSEDFAYEDTVYADTMNSAWIADNDGNLDATAPERPTPHVTATRIVRTPAESLDVSFNWWISNGDATQDFGPRERAGVGRWKEDYRDFGSGGSGTPTGDRNKYYTLRNREFDYDQIYTASISPTDTTWQSPPADLARNFADGYDTRYLLSFGPFDISPGQRLPLSFAYVGGMDLHTDPQNAVTNLPDNPDQFYSGLDFSDLATNARWASWIYDNPGVDTDSDGYKGKFHLYIKTREVDTGGGKSSLSPGQVIDTVRFDTVWYQGDGVPDFKGASPPPAPSMSLTPVSSMKAPWRGAIRVRFNGFRSETTKDVFSNEVDFEGYRVYIGRDNRAGSFSLVASYDIEDYNKFVFVQDSGRSEYRLFDTPYSLQELRDAYGPDFDPLAYSPSRPFSPPGSDSAVYFEAQDYNVSDLNVPGAIKKVYPDQPYPSSLDPELVRPDELTEEGRFKYFEYEYTIDDLLPTVPYYVNVTAFDYGSPSSGLASLETSVTLGAQSVYPLPSDEDVDERDLKVFVYPNPYRLDAGYRTLGFEGRGREDRPDDRLRAIHFANVPARCTIRIYTIDGDLVREIVHDEVPGSNNASHASWDLITRNTQLVVSGLYYWTVESEDGETQIGKIAIIM